MLEAYAINDNEAYTTNDNVIRLFKEPNEPQDGTASVAFGIELDDGGLKVLGALNCETLLQHITHDEYDLLIELIHTFLAQTCKTEEVVCEELELLPNVED